MLRNLVLTQGKYARTASSEMFQISKKALKINQMAEKPEDAIPLFCRIPQNSKT